MMNLLAKYELLRAPDGADSGPPSAPPSPPGGGSTSTSSSPSSAGTESASSGASSVPSTPAPTGGLKDAKPEASDMFNSLGSLDDLDALVGAEPALTTQPPAVVTTPVQPPAPGPTPTVAATAAPAAPQPPAQPAQPSPQTAEPASQPPVDILQELETNRDALIAGIASEQFQLAPEDIAALNEDANKVIPQLAAKVYYMGVVNTARQMKSIMGNLPQMFDNYLRVREGNEKAKDEFYKAWPALDRNKSEVNDLVVRTALAYRQAQPNLTKEQLHSIVGQVVSAHFKLPLTSAPAPAQPGAPASQVTTTPVPAAFVPAAPGSATAISNGNPAPDNPWMGIGQDFDG